MPCLLQVYNNFCRVLSGAQTDELTKLANRKTFEMSVDRVFELIVPASEHFPDDKRIDEVVHYWLVMIDIDHFKKTNDNFGHLYSDEV